jgi:hypothetical protein
VTRLLQGILQFPSWPMWRESFREFFSSPPDQCDATPSGVSSVSLLTKMMRLHQGILPFFFWPWWLDSFRGFFSSPPDHGDEPPSGDSSAPLLNKVTRLLQGILQLPSWTMCHVKYSITYKIRFSGIVLYKTQNCTVVLYICGLLFVWYIYTVLLLNLTGYIKSKYFMLK